MSVYQNINGTLSRMDASDLVQLAAVDTEGIIGGTPGATTNGQTLVDQLAADDVQAQTDIGQIKTDLSDYHVVPSKNLMMPDIYMLGTNDSTIGASTFNTASAGTGFIAKIDQNTDYVISRVGGNRSRIALSIDVPAAGGACNIINVDNDATEKSFNSGAYNYIYIYASNTSATYETIKPMVCTAAEWAASHTWVAYWQAMRDGMLLRSEQRQLGAKNILRNDAKTQTYTSNGKTITVTVYDDGSMLVNGEAGAEVSVVIHRYTQPISVKKGESYILSGCPANGSNTTYQLYANKRNSDNTGWGDIYRDYGDGVEFSIDYDNAALMDIVLLIRVGTVINNLLFKPMLRLASDPDDTYAPYCMTNPDLFNVVTGAVSLTNIFPTYAGDLNDIISGFRYVSNSATNLPVSQWGVLVAMRGDSDGTAIQLFMAITADGFYYRRKNGGSWKAWKTVTIS